MSWAVSLSQKLAQQRDCGSLFISCLDKVTDVHSVVDTCLQSLSFSSGVSNTSHIKVVIEKVLKYALSRLEVAQHSKCQCDRMTQVSCYFLLSCVSYFAVKLFADSVVTYVCSFIHCINIISSKK